MSFAITGNIKPSGKIRIVSTAPVILGYETGITGFATSNNDLTITHATNVGAVRSIAGMSTGKYYWEDTYVSGSNNTQCGITSITGVFPASQPWQLANVWSVYQPAGQLYYGGGLVNGSYLTAFSTGDIIGVAYNADLGAVWFSRNGVWGGGATISEIENGTTTNAAWSNVTGTQYALMGANDGSAWVHTANFGGSAFTYTVPSGFKAGIY